ncbi:MAG TPA: hypothetical protein VJK53_00910 [Candidatus Paceibacterota bacterium]
MSKLLTAGIKEIKKLPPEMQDSVGMDLIERAVAWRDLREKIMEGVREADAGLGRRISAKALITEFRKRHAKKKN